MAKLSLLCTVVSGHPSQALSTPPAPLETGSRKRSGLFVTISVLRLVPGCTRLVPTLQGRGYQLQQCCRRGVGVVPVRYLHVLVDSVHVHVHVHLQMTR